MSRVWAHVAGVVTLAAWAYLSWISRSTAAPGLLWWMLSAQAVAWLALLAAYRGKLPAARAILVWAILFRVAGLFAEPVLEDDYFRYLWDGRAFALAGYPYVSPPSAGFGDPGVPEEFQRILDHINHPTVPTVYGPVGQLGFLAGYGIAPGKLWAWKLLLLGAEAVMLVVLAHRLSPRAFLFLAWCPLAVFETAFNAHPDALGVMWLVLAMLVKRPRATAILCGLAVATKVFALPLVPFLLQGRGREWRWFAATVCALYLPFWAQGSSADLAGLRAMAGEWEFNSSLHALAAWSFGPANARALCLGVFVLLWSWMLARARNISFFELNGAGLAWPSGDCIFGAFFLLSPTVNPWYLLWVWPFVAARMSCGGVAALVLVPLAYVTSGHLGATTGGLFEHPAWVRPLEFGSLGAALAVDLWRAFRK